MQTSPRTPTHRSASTRRAGLAVLALTAALQLGCADRDPAAPRLEHGEMPPEAYTAAAALEDAIDRLMPTFAESPDAATFVASLRRVAAALEPVSAAEWSTAIAQARADLDRYVEVYDDQNPDLAAIGLVFDLILPPPEAQGTSRP